LGLTRKSTLPTRKAPEIGAWGELIGIGIRNPPLDRFVVPLL